MNLGIDISWKTLELAELLDRLYGRGPHVWLMGWVADYADPDNFLRVGAWRAQSGWDNETYEKLIESARRVMNQKQRMKMYRQADSILTGEAAILPLTYRRRHRLVKPWVKRYHTPAIGRWFQRDVVIEPH